MVERINKNMGVILTVVGDTAKCIVRRTYNNNDVSIVVLDLIGDYIETIYPKKGQTEIHMGVEAVLYAAKDSSNIVIEYPTKYDDEELDDIEMAELQSYLKKREEKITGSLWDAD